MKLTILVCWIKSQWELSSSQSKKQLQCMRTRASEAIIKWNLAEFIQWHVSLIYLRIAASLVWLRVKSPRITCNGSLTGNRTPIRHQLHSLIGLSHVTAGINPSPSLIIVAFAWSSFGVWNWVFTNHVRRLSLKMSLIMQTKFCAWK